MSINYDSYKELEKKEVDVRPIVTFTFLQIVSGIHKLKTKQRFVNPWGFEIVITLCPEVFSEIFKSIRDYRGENNRL